MPTKALQAVRRLLASAQLHSLHSAADFEKQVEPLHEESCLQVMACDLFALLVARLVRCIQHSVLSTA